MRLYNKKGQSVLEYTLILGVVIAAIIYVMFGNLGTGQNIKTTVQEAYSKSGDALKGTVDDLTHGVFQGGQ